MQESTKVHGDGVSGTKLWLVLMKAFYAMSSYASESIAESGLGDSDFRVLEALLHKGPLPVNALGPKVFLTPGSISVAVDRLYKQGLVTRTENAKDRRVRTVALTAKGRQLIEKVFAEHAAAMNALAEDLSAKERRRLVEGLKTLGQRATEASPARNPPAAPEQAAKAASSIR